MRAILVLRGPSGSGKSTFVKENNLQEFTVSQDEMRISMYGLIRDEYGRLTIPQKYNKKIYRLQLDIIEDKMKLGEFIVVDSTNTKDIKDIKKLAKDYRYRLYVKDFTDYDTDFETYVDYLDNRNKQRESYKVVPRQVIERQVKSLYGSRDKVEKYLIDDISEIYWRKADLNQYKRVLVAGDIHGNYYPFEEVIKEFNEKEDFLILTGDYVDRGLFNAKVIDTIYELMQLPNVVAVQGNHERWLTYHAKGHIDRIRSKQYKDITLPEIETLEDWKKKIRYITKNLAQVYYFEFAGQDYFATHSAVSYWDPRVVTYSTQELTYNRGDVNKITELWSKQEGDTPILIHGHISMEDKSVENGKVINLNSTIEFGGTMPLLILNKKGHEVKILEDNRELSKEEINKAHINRIKASRYIDIKDQGNGISSLNFGRNVFRNREWNKLTILARGLFIDNNNTNDIVARSYNKFFNFGELSDELEDFPLQGSEFSDRILAERKEWINIYRDKIKFPVQFYEKENGFLGIVSLYENNLAYFSKSVALLEDEVIEERKTHAGYLRTIAAPYKDKIKDILKNELQGYSLVFEVIDPINDPHLIEYDKPQIILLDIIENTLEDFNKLDYSKVVEVAKLIGIKPKQKKEIAYNFEEMLEIIEDILENDTTEGRVAVDEEGFHFKIKTNFYNRRKRQRALIENYLRSQEEVLLDDDRVVNFETFIRTFPKEELKDNIKIFKSWEVRK